MAGSDRSNAKKRKRLKANAKNAKVDGGTQKARKTPIALAAFKKRLIAA